MAGSYASEEPKVWLPEPRTAFTSPCGSLRQILDFAEKYIGLTSEVKVKK